MKKVFSLIINGLFRFFKIKNDKIVFEAGRGLIDGNTKAVYDYIMEKYPNQFKIVWLITKDTNSSAIRKKDCVYYRTLKSYYHLATAHYWIRNESLGSILKKKKGQIYIQLWHGNGALKHIGYDVSNEKVRQPLDYVKEWDYYIAKDELDANHIITGTGYNKKIEILGMACIDTTLKLSKDIKFKENLLDKLKIKKRSKNKKIILYAPTFRDFDLEKDIIDIPIKKFSEMKDYIFLIRLHPLVRKKVDHQLFEYENLINACDYPDASDLLAICDALITDYSSIFYQFCVLNRPIIFYPYDMEKYKKLRGGFYLDYDNELPGPICYNEEELINILKDLDNINDNYKEKINTFNEKYNYLSDGKSSERFVDKLVKGEFK